jgi:hypothetical protein
VKYIVERWGSAIENYNAILSALRHIRLMNMPEQKPITNSRDTQELLRDAGVEVMKIMSTYKEKTSLLHDYGYYEVSLLVHTGRHMRRAKL